MRHLPAWIGVYVAMCLSHASSDAQQDTHQQQLAEEEKRLDGRWTLVDSAIDGAVGQQRPTEVFFEAGKFKITVEGKVTSEGKYSIDPSTKPKSIDIRHSGKEFEGKKGLGIYDFKSGQLWLAIAQAGDENRPIDFRCKKGSRHMLIVLQRPNGK